MTLDIVVVDAVKQLRRAGLRPSERLVRQVLAGGEGAIGVLLALALDVDLLHADGPECFAPIHALRLLGELRATQMVVPLMRRYPIELFYADEELPQSWAAEVPQIVGHLGVEAVDVLWGIVDDLSWSLSGRGAALAALAYATLAEPSLRDAVVAGVRLRLAADNERGFCTQLVSALANLGVEEAYADVMRLYRERRVDQEVLAAGVARRLLLGKGEPRLACVNHSLWERYDQHGPFEPDDDAA